MRQKVLVHLLDLRRSYWVKLFKLLLPNFMNFMQVIHHFCGVAFPSNKSRLPPEANIIHHVCFRKRNFIAWGKNEPSALNFMFLPATILNPGSRSTVKRSVNREILFNVRRILQSISATPNLRRTLLLLSQIPYCINIVLIIPPLRY